jgi:hypothetical protein
MKRICPSDMRVARSNISRHARGLMKGSSPSITNISAKAPSSHSPTGLPRCAPALRQRRAAGPSPRMVRKNSLLGSTTITSLRLRKLARYASRLR